MRVVKAIVVSLLAGAVIEMGYLHVTPLNAAGFQAGNLQNLATAPQPVTNAALPGSVQRVFLDQYCTTCHNERLKTAGLMLDKVDLQGISQAPEVWEKVVQKVRAQAMPPAGMPRPDKGTYDTFASWLETELDRAATNHPNPGRPVVHRLNRAEYTNAIRDVLGLDVDGRLLLPADDSGYGFDNVADVLSVSPALLDRYLSAARKIGRLAVGDPLIRPTVETYNVSKVLCAR